MSAATAELQRSSSRHPSILLQQWNQSREDKWASECHGRVSHWSSRETNLSSVLSAGIRIIQYGSPAAGCLLLCLLSKPAAFSFVHIESFISATMWTYSGLMMTNTVLVRPDEFIDCYYYTTAILYYFLKLVDHPSIWLPSCLLASYDLW